MQHLENPLLCIDLYRPPLGLARNGYCKRISAEIAGIKIISVIIELGTTLWFSDSGRFNGLMIGMVFNYGILYLSFC